MVKIVAGLEHGPSGDGPAVATFPEDRQASVRRTASRLEKGGRRFDELEFRASLLGDFETHIGYRS